MATITLSQRQVGLDTGTPGPDPAPPYTFHFPQAPPPVHRKKGTPPDFVPAAILRETVAPAGEHQQGGSSEPVRTRSGTLPTGPSLASRGTRSEGAKAIEAEIYADGLGRWYPTHYAMDTSQEVHRSAEDIVASPQVSDVFKRFNEAVKARLAETALVTIIRELGAGVRSQLHRQHLEGDLPPPTHPDYGGFVQMENDTEDPEINKVDILVRGSNPARGVGKNHWSNVVSFVGVKASHSSDVTVDTSLQCLRYARKLCQYRPVTFHLHYVTWCGPIVRLWYLDAALFGCSRRFDTRDIGDQIEIVKIIRLLCLEEHAALLTQRWDVAAETAFSIKANEAARIKAHTWSVGQGLRPLDIRPGPFRSRTAVFADSDGDSNSGGKVTVIKVSWATSRLVTHELVMLSCISEELKSELPLIPEPIGTAEIPAGFQDTTSERTTQGSEGFPARTVSVLVTRQCLGDHIGRQVSQHDLVDIHAQLAYQLLILAGREYHYRDLNDGNIRILRGSDNTLLIVDFGNVRKNLSARGDAATPDAEATIDRAADDSRSATLEFLPACSSDAEKGVRQWNVKIDNLIREVSELAGITRATRLRQARQAILNKLPTLRDSLRKASVNSHRYIDDLESAAYLQLWQTAHKIGLTLKESQSLSKILCDPAQKKEHWRDEEVWLSLVTDYCPNQAQEWYKLMSDLRSTICDAQDALRAHISLQYEKDVSLATLQKDAEAQQWEGTPLEVKDVINTLFQGKGVLKNSGLFEIETNCFNKCIELQETAAKILSRQTRR